MRRMTAEDTRNEQALVEAWRTGDLDAMGLLYERYAPSLRAYCAHRLGNQADAEDAVHDTFLRAQAGAVGFEPGARMWPWLATIAGRVCTDTLRRRTRHAWLDIDLPAVRDIDEQLAARARTAIVGDALRDLPPRYRVPLYLRHFMGSSYNEIARAQGKSLASVRSVLLRGRRHLGHRVEAVARSERQWPLPSAAPTLWRRLRVQARQRRDAGRSWPGVLGALDPMGTLGLALAGVPATVLGFGAPAVLGTAGYLVQPVVAPLAAVVAAAAARAPAPPPSIALHGYADTTGVAVGASMSTAPWATFAPPSVVPEGAAVTNTGASVSDTEYGIAIRRHVLVDVPMVGESGTRSETHVNCESNAARTVACEVIKSTLTSETWHWQQQQQQELFGDTATVQLGV